MWARRASPTTCRPSCARSAPASAASSSMSARCAFLWGATPGNPRVCLVIICAAASLLFLHIHFGRAMVVCAAQTAEMIKTAAQPPDERMRFIEKSVNEFAGLPYDETVKAFGMKVDERMTDVRLPESTRTPITHQSRKAYAGITSMPFCGYDSNQQCELVDACSSCMIWHVGCSSHHVMRPAAKTSSLA